VTNLKPDQLEPLIHQLYANFNARSIDAVLDSLALDVIWANGMEGGHVHGRERVREYWTRQFGEIQSLVTPREIELTDDQRVRVEVHQVVHNADGTQLLADTVVHHLFTFDDEGMIARFDIEGGAPHP
jgi:ketosteroid isomerase-like protein